MRKYSRLASIQERKHKRQAFIWIALSIVLFLALTFWGVPTLAKFSAALSDLKNDGQDSKAADTIAPPPPIFSTPQIAINSAEFSISGSGKPNSKLVLTYNGAEIEVAVAGSGKFTKDVTLIEGENKFSGKIKDGEKESQPSKEYKIIYDKTAPEIEILEPQDGQNFQGSANQNITIKLSSNEESNVLINGMTATGSGDNQFIFQTKLNEVENIFVIKATDLAGNETEKTIAVTFYP